MNKFSIILIILLNILRKLRGLDKDFPIFLPENNRRHRLLWRLMVLNPLLRIDVNSRKNVRSSIPIDIYIPVCKKDLNTLDRVINGVLNNVKHPINKFFIIAKDDVQVKRICKKFDCQFIDEKSVLGYDKHRINYIADNIDRSGWLFQQLLKLHANIVVEMDNFLVVDADTIFIKPKVFIYGGKTILDLSQERHEPYHCAYKRILKRESTAELSFITHYMLFNKRVLQNLKDEIEEIHHDSWDKAILKNVEYSSSSGFSEYELYGNYLLEKVSNRIKLEYWFNNNSEFQTSNYIKSISLHSYLDH